MKESVIQSKIIDYMENKGFNVVKIIVSNKHGIADLMCCKDSFVIFIEVKKETGKEQPLQVARRNEFIRNGNSWIVVNSFDDFITQINKNYIFLKFVNENNR